MELKTSRKLLTVALFSGLLGIFLSTAAAQPEGRGERGERGRGGGPGGQDGFDVEGFLRRIDANGDGTLQASEMSGRTARFIQRLGLDTERDVSLDEVLRRARGERGESSGNSSQPQRPSAPSGEGRRIVRRVPGFDLPSRNSNAVPRFNGGGSGADIARTYGENVAGQVDRAMRRYDTNGNGVLEADEIASGQWGNPPPGESDLNGDGILTRQELAERYKSRDGAMRNAEGGDRGRDAGSGRPGNREASNPFGGDESRGRRSAEESPGSGPRDGDRGGGDRGGGGGVASFGGTASSGSGSDSGRPASSLGSTTNDRLRAYADQLIKQYDKDGDGRLSAEELSAMRRPPGNADRDGDGFVTAAELTDALGSGQTAPSASSSPPSRDSGSSSRRSDRDSSRGSSGGRSRPFSFNASDLNGDGQVQMHEFETDWTEERLAEFRALDKNGDGVITRDEIGGGGN